MTVTYKGLDCIADSSSSEYAALKKISQSGKTAWAYQQNYGYYMLYFGAVLIFLMILRNIWYSLNDYLYRNKRLGSSVIRLRFFNRVIGASRIVAYKRLPLMLSRITGLPASLGTLILLSVSTLFVFCYCFIPHFWYRGCAGFGSPPLAVRAGLMCMGMTPFLYILGGKTNFISQITGISYEKVNIFHQSLGWGSLFLALVHTIPFYVQQLREGGTARLKEEYHSDNLYQNGIPPLVVLAMLCLLSTRFSRKLCYELWFHLHWMLGVAYFGLLTWHIYGMLDAEHYMWGTLGFWGFQMLYRALVKTAFKPNTYAFKTKNGQLSKISNGNFQVVIPIEGEYEFTWKPGQHIFIRFIYGLSTLDNHPFSILSIPKQDTPSYIKLIVKPHNGLTKKLYNMINDEKTHKDLKLYIDGPYGGMSRDVLAFDKVVMVSSGSGITVTWPFVEYVVGNLDKLTNMTQQMEFKWIVKNSESLKWIEDELITVLNEIIKYDPKFLSILKFELFVTNSQEIQPQIIHDKKELGEDISDSVSNSEKSIKSLDEVIVTAANLSQFIKIHIGQKPSMSTYLQETRLLGKNCFIVSGTQSLQCDCGNAVSELQKSVIKGKVDEIYLHTENFGW